MTGREMQLGFFTNDELKMMLPSLVKVMNDRFAKLGGGDNWVGKYDPTVRIEIIIHFYPTYCGSFHDDDPYNDWHQAWRIEAKSSKNITCWYPEEKRKTISLKNFLSNQNKSE